MKASASKLIFALTILGLSSLLSGCFGWSKKEFGIPSERGCYEAHLLEAINANLQRKPIYSKMAEKIGGQRLKALSERVSNKLLNMEKSALIGRMYYDYHAEKLGAQSLGIVCNEFVSMENIQAPKWTEKPTYPFTLVSHREIKKELSLSLRKVHFDDIQNISQKWIDELNHTPMYNCMTRHLLESIRRIAFYAQTYPVSSKITWLSEDLIRGHVMALDSTAQLDLMAHSLQEKGIPIVCNDVPHVDLPAGSL
ncbi:MAG: hypothetical protein KDD61_02640 [Bdellovibrionales bacterium]|nr:hypothetical protein [Bdellovibrionales bacterium]